MACAGLQGNGVERCKQHFGEEGETFIVDVYNRRAYPWDAEAKQVGGRSAQRIAGGAAEQTAGAWQSKLMPLLLLRSAQPRHPWPTLPDRLVGLVVRVRAAGHRCPAGAAPRHRRWGVPGGGRQRTAAGLLRVPARPAYLQCGDRHPGG